MNKPVKVKLIKKKEYFTVGKEYEAECCTFNSNGSLRKVTLMDDDGDYQDFIVTDMFLEEFEVVGDEGYSDEIIQDADNLHSLIDVSLALGDKEMFNHYTNLLNELTVEVIDCGSVLAE